MYTELNWFSNSWIKDDDNDAWVKEDDEWNDFFSLFDNDFSNNVHGFSDDIQTYLNIQIYDQLFTSLA